MECSRRWRLSDLFGYNFLSSCYTFHYSSRLPGAFTEMSEFNNPTARTRVVREPHRGVYDRAEAYKILDEGFICHVGFVFDGQPFVIPTGYGRDGDNLYIHGSAASRMLRNMDEGVPVCVTVTILDGLVLARSIFNHSMNYRSVVVPGIAETLLVFIAKDSSGPRLRRSADRSEWDQAVGRP